MTLQWSAWALNQKTRDPAAKLALFLMGDATSEDDICIFSRPRLAEQLEVSLERVDQIIGHLARLNLVRPDPDQTHPRDRRPLKPPFERIRMGGGQ